MHATFFRSMRDVFWVQNYHFLILLFFIAIFPCAPLGNLIAP
ncbi:hypothetical protein HMPREF7215_1588 [Pyramidobacter piscolens W5455]|uniref:Uncharacterized protein n=1 Tax=Pyramidobacter piscolens W5455 TaxID=352165 RepID=A0ABM9ZX06_9BACT|nr:hypothetical protein HMPREF7215_1588 [Pyramidobacter piscolens W5455]